MLGLREGELRPIARSREKQTYICEPPDVTVVHARRRTTGNETLETKPIVDILLSKHGRAETYLVRVDDGTTHRLERVGQNPRYLIFYNDQPLATCGNNYVPLFHAEVEACVMGTLQTLGVEPVAVEIEKPSEYRWRMRAVLEKDLVLPMGHLKQDDKFDWGISASNSYDLTESVHAFLYIYRQVCANGLYAWSQDGKKSVFHVDKNLNHDAVLQRVQDGIVQLVGERIGFFDRLKEMSLIAPSREQAKLLMKRLGVRKYEAALLADRGVLVEFDKAEVKSVDFTPRVNSEFDLLNALSSMSQETNTKHRELEIQTGLMEKILQARTFAPGL